MAASQQLHPTAAALLPYEERVEEDRSYFRKLGVKYEPDALIALLRREKPRSAMPVACHSLADLNARHAVPVLKTLADYPVEDVKATSLLAVARLAGSEETPWLVECLSRKGTLKSYVLWALAAVGDPAACGAVTTWFERQLRKLERDPAGDPRGNVVFAVAYLEQMTEHRPEVVELLDRFKGVAPKLPRHVRSELGHFTRLFADEKNKQAPSQSDAAGRMPPGLWVSLAALAGFASSGIFASWLHWPRNAFILGYATLAGLFLAVYAMIGGVHPTVQLRRHWRAGLVGGVLAGIVLAYGVMAQPASPRPRGMALVGALAWSGVVYGAVDALLLSVVPVLSVYGSRPPEQLRRWTARVQWGGVALLASLAVTAAYHLGFTEFRDPTLVQPLIGNAMVTAGYLLTGSPLAAILAHVIMHGAAVFQGMEGTVQLPPHY
jgi:hypothetical protein